MAGEGEVIDVHREASDEAPGDGAESVDAMIERIHQRGWVFDLAIEDYLHSITDRFEPVAYTAIVDSAKGQVQWTAATPAAALAGALAGTERMYGAGS